MMKRCFYDAPIIGFLDQGVEEILGVLSKDNTFDLALEQRDAWLKEIGVMKAAITKGYYWTSEPVGDNARVVYYDGSTNAGIELSAQTNYWHVRACLAF